jgi:hypothetical protein
MLKKDDMKGVLFLTRFFISEDNKIPLKRFSKKFVTCFCSKYIFNVVVVQENVSLCASMDSLETLSFRI